MIAHCPVVVSQILYLLMLLGDLFLIVWLVFRGGKTAEVES